MHLKNDFLMMFISIGLKLFKTWKDVLKQFGEGDWNSGSTLDF